MKYFFTLLLQLLFVTGFSQQIKILFDATKAETANNADWVIDEDLNNLGWNPGASVGGGSEGNAQKIPTPAQSGITATTAGTFWKGALSSWGVDCVKQGYVVETLPYNGTITYGSLSNLQDLSYYKVFIVCEPNILFTAAEKSAILNFIQNGGSLFMVSDHNNSDRNGDGKDSPAIWNDLMSNNTVKTNPFGIAFDLVDVSPNTFNIPNLPNDSLLHGPMGAVTQATWFNGTTMTLSPSVNASVKGVVYTPGSSFGNTGVMAAYARFGKGKVAAIGDSSPCDDGSGDTGDQLYDGWITDASGNHERLIMNATIWLASNDSFVAPPPPLLRDLKMDSMLQPQSLQKGMNTISIQIKNTGKAKIDTAVFYYQVNAGSMVSAPVNNLNLNADSIYKFTFTTPLTISTNGSYTLCVWVKTTGDTIYNNDTICKSYQVKSTGVKKPTTASEKFSIYPNPLTKNELTIEGKINSGSAIQIFDINGREIQFSKITEQDKTYLLFQNLEAGLYFLQITNPKEGVSKVVKLVVSYE